MLSFHQINQVESLFIAIDSNKIFKKIDRTHYYLIDDVIDQVFIIRPKQGEYLLWLLNRWIHQRNHPNHLPKRIIRFG